MFVVAKICKCALRASIEGYLAVAASTPTYSSLVSILKVIFFRSCKMYSSDIVIRISLISVSVGKELAWQFCFLKSSFFPTSTWSS